jgi:hypothetical protein
VLAQILTNINSESANKIHCLKSTDVFKFTATLRNQLRHKYLCSVCVLQQHYWHCHSSTTGTAAAALLALPQQHYWH